MSLSAFASRHPLAFALGATIAWLVLLTLFSGAAASALGTRFTDPGAATLARLAVAACVVLTAWRLGWLRSSGIARRGHGRIWLFALAGLGYSAAAALYSFYGHPGLDPSTLALPAARLVVLGAAAVALCEELLFRGIVLHALARAWATTRRGLFAALASASLLFAALHLVQTLGGLPLVSGLILVAETAVVSFWWGALVAAGGSVWPAVMLHAAVNAVVSLQALSMPVQELGATGYTLLLVLAVPLGAHGAALAAHAPLTNPTAEPRQHSTEAV